MDCDNRKTGMRPELAAVYEPMFVRCPHCKETYLHNTVSYTLIRDGGTCGRCQIVASADVKPTNPKDALGVSKAPMSTVSAAVLAEIGVAMLEGACKYGRHNYRVVGVRASVYYDAAMRHMMAWWEGEDIDPDSGLSHVAKAITSLVVLRDAMIQGMVADDRAPPSKEFYAALNTKVAEIRARYADKNPTHYTIGGPCAAERLSGGAGAAERGQDARKEAALRDPRSPSPEGGEPDVAGGDRSV